MLQLVEQARVLDGDHGLIGEGLQQPDMMIIKETRLDPGNGNGTDEFALAEHWHRQRATPAAQPCYITQKDGDALVFRVDNLTDFTFAYRLADRERRQRHI